MPDHLPPELTEFASFLDAQPGTVQVVFQYCLALLMVEAGKATIIDTVPGDRNAIYTFETIAGDVFSLHRPDITSEQEEKIKVYLRWLLEEEDKNKNRLR